MNPTTLKFRRLDVRPLMARGEEPFRSIMALVAALRPDEGLELVTPSCPRR